MERLIAEQLRIMEKQLDLMRLAEAAQDAAAAGHARPATLNGTETGAMAHLEAVAGLDASSSNGIGHALEAPVTRVPLTDAQRDVWIICQLSDEGSAAFNLATTLTLTGELDVEALREAVRRLVQRHESLRTTIDPLGDHLVVQGGADAAFAFVDLSDSPEPERAERIGAIVDGELTNPYDLVEGPLFRTTLIRSAPGVHTLVLAAHHLVCDGWSFGVLHRELGALYSESMPGEHAALQDATQFREYVTWRVDQSVDSEPYWLSLYDAPPAQLDLPVDMVRPPIRSFEYGSQRAVIRGESLAALKELASLQGVTPFIVLLAAWEILLHRLSGQVEFASGVFVSGQASMGVRDLVGLCANLLPLRVRVSPEESLSDVPPAPQARHVRRLRQPALHAREPRLGAAGDA